MDNTFVILMMPHLYFCCQPHLKKDLHRKLERPPPESLSPSATEITID